MHICMLPNGSFLANEYQVLDNMKGGSILNRAWRNFCDGVDYCWSSVVGTKNIPKESKFFGYLAGYTYVPILTADPLCVRVLFVRRYRFPNRLSSYGQDACVIAQKTFIISSRRR
jgi:hypothetical protein